MLKTMVAHISIDKSETAYIAKGNAYTNFCLSKKMLNKQSAYEFSTVAAEYLDLVVFDNDFYKNTYENEVVKLDADFVRGPAEAARACRDLGEHLPSVTDKLLSKYRSYAKELGVARSQENQRIAESMSSFRAPNAPVPQMTFPSASVPQEPKTQSFLINSGSGGLTQCKVVNNSYVFCL